MKNYLNLGCGNRFHKNWTNVDFVSTGEDVQAHNLLNGIPFADQTFEVVYHSHVLEHFTKKDGQKFVQECYRVLKNNGILRIAIPDLEQIAKEYLKNLALALQDDKQAQDNYEWIKIELYDQTVRNESSGDMAKYIFQEKIPNETYVFDRIGEEGRKLREYYLTTQNNPKNNHNNTKKEENPSFLRFFKMATYTNFIKRKFFVDEIDQKAMEIGKFRLGGEIHQWMYDRYSLKKLLEEIGFTDFSVKTAFESNILDWNTYELESKNNIVFKPDSLFVEARK